MALHGTVRTWDQQKRYGFIKRDDGGEVFVHVSEVRKSHIQGFDRGVRVRFDIRLADNGRPAAFNIRSADEGTRLMTEVFGR